MADVSYTDLRGLGVPDPRWKPANLKARGTGSTDSAYTESTPIAGTPEPSGDYDMVLRARGTCSQEAHLQLVAHRAGHPPRAGAYWSDQSQASPVNYGWEPLHLVTGWETLLWQEVVTGANIRPSIARTDDGRLMVAYSVSSLGVVQIKVYDPSDASWTSANLAPTGASASYITTACGLLALPDGTILAYVVSEGGDQIDCYSTPDYGSTWGEASLRVVDGGLQSSVTINEISAAISGGEVAMVVAYDESGGQSTAAWLHSTSNGLAFTSTTVDVQAGTTTDEPVGVDVMALDGGGFLVVYLDDSGTNDTNARRFGSASVDWDDADEVQIANTSDHAACGFRAEDGSYYALTYDQGTPGGVIMFRSEDAGATWDQQTDANAVLQLEASVATDQFEPFAAAVIGGRMVLVARWIASVADEDPQSVAAIWFGGFSTQTAPFRNNMTLVEYRDEDVIAYDAQAITGRAGGLYLPIELPGNINWTASGSSEALISPGKLEIDTTSGTTHYTRTWSDSNVSKMFVEFAVDIDSGEGNKSANFIVVALRMGDASTYEYEVYIRLGADGYSVQDVPGLGVLGTTSVDLTSKVHIRVAIDRDSEDVLTWYASHAHSRSWTAGAGGTITDAGATANTNRIRFGHIASVTATSRWSMIGYCAWPGSWGPRSPDFGASWTSPADIHPWPLPTTPALVHDGIEVWAVDGPAKLGDTWAIKQDSQYSAKNLFWQTEPGPSRFWRSVNDDSDVELVIDLSGLTSGDFLSSCLFVTLLGINFNRADLERWDGAAWQTIATVQANDGLTSLQHTRWGDVIEPLKGGATHKAARYIFEGDLVGGTAKFSGDPTPLRKILWNTSGAWTDESSTRPAAQLDGVDDTEATSGALEMWMPQVSAVITEHTATNRLYRLKIPAQETADGYFQCGQVLVGHVHVFGRHYSRGWTVESRPVYDLQDLANGSSRAVSRGPLLREIEIGWPDGDDAMDVQAASPVPDYISGSTSGIELASPGQTLRALAGLVKQTDGAVHPVVYFGRIERTSGATTIANPRQFMYGAIVSSVIRTNVLGDEQIDELDRGEPITIREIK